MPELAGKTIYEANGCLYCANRGYSGRLALFEMIPITQEWAQKVAAGIDEVDAIESMKKDMIKLLTDDAIEKLLEGKTSYQDIITAITVW